MDNKGHNQQTSSIQQRSKDAPNDDFVLEKSIFSNIFEKDIRRVYIYKKAERLAKAIHLITPAFVETPALRNRIDRIAVGLVDAAILPPAGARTALSRELLALSSVLAVARVGNLLSSMNSDLIAREAQLLLQEVAAYEEPRLFLDDAPSLASIAKQAPRQITHTPSSHPQQNSKRQDTKGHIKDTGNTSRRDTILSVLKDKAAPVPIKDISLLIRDVSEKTIQRELQALLEEGKIRKAGERRWSTYSLA